jgi:hypothetical protein
MSIIPSIPILITPERSPNKPHNAPNTRGAALIIAKVDKPIIKFISILF